MVDWFKIYSLGVHVASFDEFDELFHKRENEERCELFHAYKAEAWERFNDIGDYDRSGWG